jgi:integrase
MISTLDELAGFVKESGIIPNSQRRYQLSAVNRVKVLVGNGLADVRLEPRAIFRQLDRISPAMAGMTRQSYANLKSRFRQACRHAAPHLAPARSYIKLTGDLALFEALLPLREQRQLSRLLRFIQAMGWSLHEVGEEHVQQFEGCLEHEGMLPEHGKIARATRRAWNRAVDTVPGWPDRRLALPQPKQTPYWIKLEQLPDSLQQEVEAYLHRLEHPDLGATDKAIASSTAHQFRVLFITLASALVASGIPAEDLTSVASLVHPDRIRCALGFLHARAGRRVTPLIHQMAYRVRKVAARAGLSDKDLRELDHILTSVKRLYPARPGLADKNRLLLGYVDDAAFVDRLLAFPHRLVQVARANACKRHAASYARDAVAVELLLTCSMRVGNLVDLRLGESIQRYGQGRQSRWVVEIAAENVKNNQPLRYKLLPESARLLEWYLAEWHDAWCGPGSPWLFPDRKGHHVDPHLLSDSIARRAFQHVGARITWHQFRHLAAEFYLQADPTGIGVVSEHLGHRRLETTRRYYAREQTRIATERYHAVLVQRRSRAFGGKLKGTRIEDEP